jgi:hypothetical protein
MDFKTKLKAKHINEKVDNTEWQAYVERMKENWNYGISSRT